MNSAIALNGLIKSYGRRWASPKLRAIDHVSLNVAEGEVFGFIGPNGAGKSTTIKIMTGAIFPDSGTASLFGIDVYRPESRRSVAYVPENSSLPDYLTPLEILLMALKLHGKEPVDPDRHCLGWLERFDLSHVARKVIRGFSKGMAQRTALAHALAVEPRLLILDEPLSGLDPVGRRDVIQILMEYRNAGGTIFLTSHVLHDVERLADRFGFINKGHLLTIQSPNDLMVGEQFFTVRSFGAAMVPDAHQERPGRWVAEIPGDRLWSLLESMRQAGHQIAEVRPTLTLESAFFKFLGRMPAERPAEQSARGESGGP